MKQATPSKHIALWLLLPLLIAGQQACKKPADTVTAKPTPKPVTATGPVLPDAPFSYAITYPQHIQDLLTVSDNTPADNPITNDGATLGRVLFYDKMLSANNTTACASCHKQSLAFSDDLAKSVGHAGSHTRRNSMPLLNLRFYRSGKMFWDERAATLEQQVLMPFQDPVEMGITLTALTDKMNGLDYYKPLFQKAFGSSDITPQRISRALAQFLRSIVTYRSKYDLVKQGLAAFSPQEEAGRTIFNRTGPIGACIDCHAGGAGLNEFQQAVIPIRNPPDFNNTNDWGKYEVTGDPSDSSTFKIPSLRNTVLTAPYMHNGSVASLQDLFTNNYHRFELTPVQKQNIIAFLHTLTDNDILTDPRFADPFK